MYTYVLIRATACDLSGYCRWYQDINILFQRKGYAITVSGRPLWYDTAEAYLIIPGDFCLVISNCILYTNHLPIKPPEYTPETLTTEISGICSFKWQSSNREVYFADSMETYLNYYTNERNTIPIDFILYWNMYMTSLHKPGWQVGLCKRDNKLLLVLSMIIMLLNQGEIWYVRRRKRSLHHREHVTVFFDILYKIILAATYCILIYVKNT